MMIGVKAKRGDGVAWRSTVSYCGEVSGPTVYYHLGQVISITRDGEAKRARYYNVHTELTKGVRPILLDTEAKVDNLIVEDWLLWYKERKAEYEARRAEIIDASPPPMDERLPVRTNVTGDPTPRKAIALAMLDNADAQRWLALVEDVERRLPPKMQIFLRLRREYRHCQGRNGWVAAVQTRLVDELAKLTGKNPEDISVYTRQTLHNWWEKIIDYTARAAAKRGLLR